jgi:hypothetical protein
VLTASAGGFPPKIHIGELGLRVCKRLAIEDGLHLRGRSREETHFVASVREQTLLQLRMDFSRCHVRSKDHIAAGDIRVDVMEAQCGHWRAACVGQDFALESAKWYCESLLGHRR